MMNGIINQLVKVKDIETNHERKGCWVVQLMGELGGYVMGEEGIV
jgi:hypothetical protein